MGCFVVVVVVVRVCVSTAASSAMPLGVAPATAVPFVAALPLAWPLAVPFGVADAYSCFAARKLLRSEFVSSRLERYAPGLRMMEGPPDTMLLRCDGAREN